MSFLDVLASCDAVVTKVGYGLFTEAAVNGKVVVYARRGDWPDEPYLIEWFHRNTRAREVGESALVSGQLREAVDELLTRPEKPRVAATGAAEAAQIMLDVLAA